MQSFEANAARQEKKRYTAPTLSEHGKVADITKGNNGSQGDGGATQNVGNQGT